MAKTKTGASSQAKATKKATATKSSGKNRAAVKSGGGGSGCSSILVALAELKMIGKNSPTRSMVARMAGYTGADQAGFKKALTGLSSKNYLNYYSSTTLELTDAGSKQVPTDLNPPRTNADLHNRIKLLLPPKARSVFDVLSDGQSHTRMEIAKALGYPNDQTAGFKKMLGQVSGLGFLTYPSPSTARLSDDAFLFPVDEKEGGDVDVTGVMLAGAMKLKKKAFSGSSSGGKPSFTSLSNGQMNDKKRSAESPTPSLPHEVSGGDGDESCSSGAKDEKVEDKHDTTQEETGGAGAGDAKEEEEDDHEENVDSESEWEG